VTRHEWITLGVLVVLGLLHAVVFYVWRSFGTYTERIERASVLCRQSNEVTRQSNVRTLEEVRANTEENALTHEKTLAVFAEVARLRHELHETLINQRSA
jgi:hypothetical protein